MEQLDHPDWLLREYDFRAGMSVEDMAERYGVSIYTVRTWYQKFGWTRAQTSKDLLKVKFKRILFAAEKELMRGDLDDCNKRLKTILQYLKIYEGIEQLDGAGRSIKQVGKTMHDTQTDQGENKPSLEDLRAEIERRLERITGIRETKCAKRSDTQLPED
ncbi:hypothetical protein [Hirschia baltica]|uniref:Uncharacterized protein n=1 Tax=Hirschia baltica (strain ATCC 49814 / DSM 5838 / IFAM 1418) TaxID=582402 RepID=C6XIB2_HIRBI|nr:hypothetical protein [Hirschia baltica]ACT58938.1 hypothetical protein Hbal_1246 [Hirschia baltica ATCC 49814]